MADTHSTDSLIQRLENITGAISGCRVVVDYLACDTDADRLHVSTLFLVEAQLQQMTERLNEIVIEMMRASEEDSA